MHPYMKKIPFELNITDSQGFAHNKESAMIVLNIKRESVESGDLGHALDSLLVMTESEENIRRYQGSLVVVVDGYSADRRELSEIPEVRAYFAKLSQEWPFWQWFLMRQAGMFPLVMALHCRVNVLRNKQGVVEGTHFIDTTEIATVFADWDDRAGSTFNFYNIGLEERIASAKTAVAEFMFG